MKKLALLFVFGPVMAMGQAEVSADRNAIVEQPAVRKAMERNCGDFLNKPYRSFVNQARVEGSLAKYYADCVQDCSILSFIAGSAALLFYTPTGIKNGDSQATLVGLGGAALAAGSAFMVYRLEKDIIHFNDKKTR